MVAPLEDWIGYAGTNAPQAGGTPLERFFRIAGFRPIGSGDMQRQSSLTQVGALRTAYERLTSPVPRSNRRNRLQDLIARLKG